MSTADGSRKPAAQAPPAEQLPADEQARLAELYRLRVLDSEPERVFDDIARLAAYICGTESAAISFIDADRQWFKARQNISVAETPRDVAFCAHAIRNPDSTLVVEDATADPRFAANAFVTGEPHIRFYAGAPMVTSTGASLGTVCAIGRRPHTLDERQLDALRALARQAVTAVERDATAAELAASRAHLESAQEVGGLGSWSYRLSDGEFTGSDQLARLLGYPADEPFPGLQALLDCIHPDDRESVDREGARTLAEGSARYECRFQSVDGVCRHVLGHGKLITDDGGQPTHIIGTVQDVTEQRRLQEELLRRVTTDPLTGTRNRESFLTALADALADPAAAPVSVLAVDIDGLSAVNDTLGVDIGDRMLRHAARTLENVLRPGDVLARLGGGDFAVMLPRTGAAAAAQVATRLRAAMAEPVEIDGIRVALDVTIGTATSGGSPGENAAPASPAGQGALGEAMRHLRNATLALSAAKRHEIAAPGRYSSDLHTRATRSRELHLELRHALQRDQLQLAYQPLVDLQWDAVVGGEALLRWTHPDLGPVSPMEFIPLAEETGLIVPFERWVLRQACAQAVEWGRRRPRQRSLGVSVNISGHHLTEPTLIDEVAGVLADTGLAPARLTLEITETVAMADTAEVAERLDELRALGVKLAIDDFGTGHSSLARLAQFPVHTLKIDKSLVDSITDVVRARSLCEAVVALGRTLDMTPLAEGVETAEQAAVLREIGCPLGQGYLFSRPVSPERFAALLVAPLQVVSNSA